MCSEEFVTKALTKFREGYICAEAVQSAEP